MTRHIFALLALLGSVAAASAQGLTTMTVLDSTGTTKTYRMVQDSSNRLSYTHVICDPTVGANAATNCATVTSGALTVAGAVTNAGTFATQLTGATNNINNIAGTVSLPTGAATAANQGLITTWAGDTLGAMANYGTSPGAVKVPAVNAFVTNTTSLGRAVPGSSSPVVLPANKYIAVAASQTATTLVGAGSGATGDYLSHCVIYPTATTTGVVTVFDNTNTAANSAILFAGGASSTSNLTPIAVPVGALSVNGAWKVTTGTAVSVVCYGNFT